MIKVEDHLYDFKVAVPLIVSLLAFQEPLPNKMLNKLAEDPDDIPLRNEFNE